MPFPWKKVLIVGLIFMGLIVLPVFLCSNAMMGYYQNRIDRNPDTGHSKWLQLASADVCFRTYRPEMAAEYYRKFRDRYKEDVRRPRAFLRYAQALERSSRNADAVAEYRRYLEEYPEREDKQEAAAGIERIQYVNAPR